jgi:hypothetical protein
MRRPVLGLRPRPPAAGPRLQAPGSSQKEDASLAIVVPQVDTLEDVLAWCRAVGANVVDVIVQDEFTHDVIISHPKSFVVFDTT